jgi:hypothetical protein
MPIRAFTFPTPAFTMVRSSRSRCADLGVHVRAEPAFGASNEKQAMVSWSRFTESMTIYTDDIAATRRAAQRSGEREFARDIRGLHAAPPKKPPEEAAPGRSAEGRAEGFCRAAPLERGKAFKRSDGFRPGAGFSARVREVYERIREEYEAVRATIKRAFGLEENKAIGPEPAMTGVPNYLAQAALRRQQAKEREGPTR